MAASSDFNTTRGTALATFTQNGTYSNTVDLGGGWLVGLYSDNYPAAVAAGITFRASWNPSGTGWPVQGGADGTALKTGAFGSGTFYSLGAVPYLTAPIQYLTLQVANAGTPGVAAGGTIVLVTSS